MERHYTLKRASEILGVSVKTLRRWSRQGKIKVIRTRGGHRRVPESEILRLLGLLKKRGKIIGYARVSSRSQKDDLERQIKAIEEYCERNGLKNYIILKE